jgi:hypothetical protein
MKKWLDEQNTARRAKNVSEVKLGRAKEGQQGREQEQSIKEAERQECYSV